MAILISPDGNQIYLYEHHSFGRKADKVDTVVQDSLVSRVHAIIKWFDGHWQIRDLSSNGTWVNGVKISGTHFTVLKKNTNIQFGNNHSGSYHIADLSPPQNVLICTTDGKSPTSQLITLQTYHLLPNEDSPEIALYWRANRWWSEQLNIEESPVRLLEDGDVLQILDQYWLFRASKTNDVTIPAESQENLLASAELHLMLSQDEEHCRLTLFINNASIDFGMRSHHLLILALARKRLEDEQKSYHHNDHGWVYVSHLSADLGLDEPHLNIQIHRARKQLADKLHQVMDCSQFFERRTGELRLACPNIRIVQGDTQYASAGFHAHE